MNHVTPREAQFKRLYLLDAAADGGGNERQGDAALFQAEFLFFF